MSINNNSNNNRNSSASYYYYYDRHDAKPASAPMTSDAHATHAHYAGRIISVHVRRG